MLGIFKLNELGSMTLNAELISNNSTASGGGATLAESTVGSMLNSLGYNPDGSKKTTTVPPSTTRNARWWDTAAVDGTT